MSDHKHRYNQSRGAGDATTTVYKYSFFFLHVSINKFDSPSHMIEHLSTCTYEPYGVISISHELCWRIKSLEEKGFDVFCKPKLERFAHLSRVSWVDGTGHDCHNSRYFIDLEPDEIPDVILGSKPQVITYL